MTTIRVWSLCIVVIAGFALLAVPGRPVPLESSSRSLSPVSAESLRTSLGPAACTTYGRPCSPKASTCCLGLKCVFQGGSTRVGYACRTGVRSAPSPSWELSENTSGRRELQDLFD